MNKILAIIPARGGSRGIRNKNIVKINGRSLIDYTIKSALKAKKNGIVAKVVVSTDSEKIAKISKKLGASVPFLRPKSISGDKAKSVDVILHAIEYFEKKGIFFNYIVLLQPTSPLRRLKDIKQSIDLCLKNKSDSLISAYQKVGVSDSIIYTRDNNLAVPVLADHNKGARRQESKNIFIRNGAIYMTSVEYLKKYQKIISDKPLLFEMPEGRSLNIDEAEDLRILRKYLNKN
jgi:CMP-N-acetylneuraminic acid synthetase